jgi:hypothetical protein
LKVNPIEVLMVTDALISLGGIGTSSNIRKQCQSVKKVRTILRALERSGKVKTDRPLYPPSLELRWEIVPLLQEE